MFLFTKPLSPNFSHLYLAAYVYVYASLEPVLEKLEKLESNILTTGNNKIQHVKQGELDSDATRKVSPSEVTFTEVEDGFLIVDRESHDEQ